MVCVAILTSLISYASDTTLAGLYLFNGNADDSSGNMLDGTVFGANPALDRFGTDSSALNYEGNEYVELPSNFDFIEKTVSVWFNSKASSLGLYAILQSDDPSMVNGRYGMSVNIDSTGPKLLFSIGTSLL